MVSKQDVRPDVKVRTLPMQVASHLVGQIAANELIDDHVPSELDITQQFGVSRVVARETLKILSSLDIVHIAQGRRVVLRPPEEWDYLSPLLLEWLPEEGVSDLLREFQEARLLLEPELAARAATRITKSSLRRLNELVDQMVELEDRPDDYLEVDHAFHMEICRASQNRILDRIMYSARWLLATSRRVTNEEPHGVSAATAIHRQILAAIESGDADAARDVMRTHMELNIEILGKSKRASARRRRSAR